MAGSFSDFWENAVLDGLLGGGTISKPATVYIGLFTVNPTDAGGGTEVSGNAYARAAVTNNSTNFPNASAGAKTNGTQIAFPTPTGSWGTITGLGIFDASSAGNLLAWSDLTTSKAVGSGDPVTIEVGALAISLT